MSAGRAKFWSSLFRKQPIEDGVRDPLEEDVARVREGVRKASLDLTDSVEALLDDLQRRHNKRRNPGQHNV